MKEDKILLEFVEEVTINEGLVFFKNSKRIDKYIEKLQKQNQNDQMQELISKLKIISEEFKEVEEYYKSGNKLEAKEVYNRIKERNESLIDTLNKETMKKTLMITGMATSALNLILRLTTGTGLLGNIFKSLKPTLTVKTSDISYGAGVVDLSAKDNVKIDSMDKYNEVLKKIEKQSKKIGKI